MPHNARVLLQGQAVSSATARRLQPWHALRGAAAPRGHPSCGPLLQGLQGSRLGRQLPPFNLLREAAPQRHAHLDCTAWWSAALRDQAVEQPCWPESSLIPPARQVDGLVTSRTDGEVPPLQTSHPLGLVCRCSLS
eukprot:154304-Chlamydomonas_euryale.AAC.6